MQLHFFGRGRSFLVLSFNLSYVKYNAMNSIGSVGLRFISESRRYLRFIIRTQLVLFTLHVCGIKWALSSSFNWASLDDSVLAKSVQKRLETLFPNEDALILRGWSFNLFYMQNQFKFYEVSIYIVSGFPAYYRFNLEPLSFSFH